MAVIELTAVPDGNPPQVRIVARDLPSSTAAVTIWRTAAGRTKEVRGAIRTNASDALSLVDFEAPFGVPIIYRAEPFTATGDSLGLIGLAETQLDVRETWVHNPLDPAGAIVVGLEEDSARSISHPPQGELVVPLGSQTARWVGAGRSGITAMKLTLYTDSIDDAQKLDAMLGGGMPPVLCFRFPAGQMRLLPPVLYAAVPAGFLAQEVSGTSDDFFALHEGTVTETAPPTPGLFIPLLTYAHFNAYYASYAALNADNATYLAVNTRYDLVR